MQTGIPKFEIVWREERQKFYVQWREGGRLKRVSACTDNPEAAQRFLADFIGGWVTPTTVEKDNITIAEIIDIFTEHKKKLNRKRFENDTQLEERFIRRNIENLDNGIIYPLTPVKKHWGDWFPRQINNHHCREFIQMRLEQEKVSSTTAKKSFDVLVAAMNHARKEGLLTTVPYIEKPPEGPPRDKWARPEEVKRLLDKLSKHFHLELFALLALHTLSRKRAILELQWEQVDFELKRIDFNPPNRVRTKKRRVPVPMNNTLLAALLKAREVAVTRHVIEWRGEPCYEIGRAFRKYAKQAGLDWITPHVLRHTGATLMAQNKVSMVEIAGIMGDRIDTVEKHYLKYHPDYLKDATAALDKIYA